VETIEAFGFAIKVGSNLLNGTPFYFVLFLFSTNEFFFNFIQVNGYDRLRVVDSSFRSKYHINLLTHLKGATEALIKSQLAQFGASANSDLDAPTISLGECHKATIIDGRNIQTEGVRGEESDEKERDSACPAHISRPILPWLNGDGSVNSIVYEALTRRILGIVMQKPGILEV
jgi:general transcription factor 3C polypeptide 1